jgi:hypothetical protein
MSLVDALSSVLLDPSRRAELSERGLAGVREHFDLRRTTVPALLDAYARVIGGARTGRAPNPW